MEHHPGRSGGVGSAAARARGRRRLPVSFSAMVVSCVLLAGACSGGDTPELSGEQADDPVLVTGRAVYQERCARCHGASGDGGAGPKLADGRVVERYPEPEQQEAVIREGRGTMPAWDGTLSDGEIDAVVRYTREVL